MVREMDLDYSGLEFTVAWFRKRNLSSFREHVHPQFAGKPTLYLELGVFEGMSMCWMLQKVLTHPDSRAVGVDPWLQTSKLDEQHMEEVKRRAYRNVQKVGDVCRVTGAIEEWTNKCQLVRGNSDEVLHRMLKRGGFAGVARESVDLCLVDGNHYALPVLSDCRLVWQLLKPGGVMMMDDVRNDIPKGDDHVEAGLRMFLEEPGHPVEKIWESRYMEAYRKVTP